MSTEIIEKDMNDLTREELLEQLKLTKRTLNITSQHLKNTSQKLQTVHVKVEAMEAEKIEDRTELERKNKMIDNLLNNDKVKKEADPEPEN